MVTIVVGDERPIIRAGFRLIVSKCEDIAIVGEGKDAGEVKRLVSQFKPQILFIDWKMFFSQENCIVDWVHQECPSMSTLILGDRDCDTFLARTMFARATGYLTQKESFEELINAIRRASLGEKLYTDEQYARVYRWREIVGERWDNITEREHEVLCLLVQGLDNLTIAEILKVKLNTVAYHITNILHKLELSSRQEAIVWVNQHFPSSSNKY